MWYWSFPPFFFNLWPMFYFGLPHFCAFWFCEFGLDLSKKPVMGFLENRQQVLCNDYVITRVLCFHLKAQSDDTFLLCNEYHYLPCLSAYCDICLKKITCCSYLTYTCLTISFQHLLPVKTYLRARQIMCYFCKIFPHFPILHNILTYQTSVMMVFGEISIPN